MEKSNFGKHSEVIDLLVSSEYGRLTDSQQWSVWRKSLFGEVFILLQF